MNINIAISEFGAILLDLIHLILLFFPIMIYFYRFPIYVVRFMFLFCTFVPLSWIFFKNKCIITVISKQLRGDEEKDYNFSQRYLTPLYKTIINIFNLSDDKTGFDQAINIHWIINMILLWYYLFYYRCGCI